MLKLVNKSCQVANIKPTSIAIDLTGTCAGTYNPNKHHIRLHPKCDYSTVIHEVAHAVDFMRYGMRKSANGNNIHHDVVFRDIMREIHAKLGSTEKLETGTTHSLGLQPSKKMRRWEYNCGCKENIKVSTVIHNRIQKGQTRICNNCAKKFKKAHFEGEV